ncbi:MAG TPA: protein translocase subunit SecF [Micromonosporaceae bacterium]
MATSLFRRLYRGESNLDFIGSRKKWYLASGIIILICILSIIFRQFNFTIDFVGGDQYKLPVKPGTSITEIQKAADTAVPQALKGATVADVVKTGGQGQATYVVQTSHIPAKAGVSTTAGIVEALAKAGNVPTSAVNPTQISGTWGGEITGQAIKGLVAFLILVSAFIAVRFRDWRMAVAALGALAHDMILTAGVYSLVGFQVSPSTVVGLLTILGFSLYDTVVVFDKVDENTHGLLAATRYTYGEAANMAVNQTLMRSINTSLIGLLPVAGLLFVGAGILGVGSLEDLALVLFVGMLTGAYSSLFLATPWLVDLKMTDSRYKNHAQRVLSRRAGIQAKREEAAVREAAIASGTEPEPEVAVKDEAFASSVAPRVGAKPNRPQPKRPGARPQTRPSNSGGKRRS